MFGEGLKATILRFLPMLSPLAERLQVSPGVSRLAKGTLWSIFGTVLARGLSVCASIFVARHLGKQDFGALGIVQSTMLNFSVFVGCGLGVTATKYIPELRSSNPLRASRILGISGLVAAVVGGAIALVLAAAAPWMAERILAAPRLTDVVRIGALLLFLNTLNGAQNGALAGFEAFRSMAWVNIWTGIATFPIMVAGVFFGGLTGGVWGLVVSAALNWMLAHLAIRREARRSGVPFGLNGVMSEWRVLSGFGLPSVLGGIVLGPVNWLCSAILVNQPEGYAEMGVFNATNQLFALVLFLPGLLGQVLLPALSESLGNGDRGTARKLLRLALSINAATALPFIVVLSIASPWLMSLYGAGFEIFWPVLVISLVTGGILALQSPATQLLNAKGRAWVVVCSNLIWGILFVGLTLAFIERGSKGLVTARLIAYMVQSLFLLWVIKRFNRET